MPLFLCHVHLSVPTSTSHLLSDTASFEQAALSSLYVFLSCVALRGSRAKTGLGLVMLIKVGLCSIISPIQASKAFLFARATATVDAIVPLRSSFGLALGSDTSDLFSRRFIKRFPTAMLPCFQMRCIACHVC